MNKGCNEILKSTETRTELSKRMWINIVSLTISNIYLLFILLNMIHLEKCGLDLFVK